MIYEERIDNFILGKMSDKEEKEFLSECKTNSTLRKEADRMIFENVIRRMQVEHPQDKLEIDKFNNRIKLTWCQRDGILDEIDKKLSII